MYEKLFMERLQKVSEEKYKGGEGLYKKEIKEMKIKKDEYISNANSIEKIKRHGARKDTEIRKLQEQVNFINKEKVISEKERKKIYVEPTKTINPKENLFLTNGKNNFKHKNKIKINLGQRKMHYMLPFKINIISTIFIILRILFKQIFTND